jgi:uncharacterized protein YqeY
MLLSSIHNYEIEQRKPIEDQGVITVLDREANKRRESIEAFEKGNRQDLVAQEKAELEILLGYMPQQMSHEEVEEFVRKTIAEIGASGPGDKGKVMSQIMPQLKGRAQGQEINAIVTELLSGN